MSAATTSMSFTNLQETRDLLALVLSFIPLRDCLLKTDMVNKAFHYASKHPMCWDTTITLRSIDGSSLTQLVNVINKLQVLPKLNIEVYWLLQLSIPTLANLKDIRRLNIRYRYSTPVYMADLNTALSALTRLERFSPRLNHQEIEFPTMPNLGFLELELIATKPVTIVNMDSQHFPLLTELKVAGGHLEQTSFPESLTKLTLTVEYLSPQVQANVAMLPNLVALAHHCDDILSQPDLRFCSTITGTMISTWCGLTHQARENLRKMTHLTRLMVRTPEVPISSEDPANALLTSEAIASLPSLTSLYAHNPLSSICADAGLAPFRHATSMQNLIVTHLPPNSLQHFAHPSLTALSLMCCPLLPSLSPLSVCVNLTTLQAGIMLSEQDAQVLSGLTKLEKLFVATTCEACFTHICRLPRLTQLCVLTRPADAKLVGPVALQALGNLAPIIEQLMLPRCVDPQATVLVLSQLAKLNFLNTRDRLTDDQISLLRSKLPRLCRLEDTGRK